jgi:hypothetical protein
MYETRPPLEVARDLALQKIGRNVVNFQKLEAMLKYISAFASLHGPVSELAETVATRTERLAKWPMGRLVNEASNVLHQDRESTEHSPAELADAWFSATLTVTTQDGREWRKVMEAVVAERNALMHQMLVTFDPNSLESCELLSAKLDEQRSRTIPAYEHVQSIVLTIRDSYQDMARHLEGITAQDLTQKLNN